MTAAVCHSHVMQSASPVRCDMIGPVTLDLVLRVVFRGVMSVAFVVEIPSMDRNDGPRDTACLGVPAHVIANFESFGHIAHL